MKEILKDCIIVKGVNKIVDYIKSIFVQGQVVRPCEDTNEAVQESGPVTPKVRVKYKKRKKEEVPQAEAATPEKLAKLRKPRAKKTEKHS